MSDINSEERARKIKYLADQMDKIQFELQPPWSEEEYILISTIWKIFKSSPGTSGKKMAMDEIRKAIEKSLI